ncbi:CLUMA_CG009754, isoform A [Clunio marinus]|uniref:CLUMA_CG009754, isoform A n=1 Tax=Clunio marinus TaxID=568069 RepID=A0A1J1I7P9_9DIPT|nr:CLUMA_CG009754, isoform A [Clunio marinus]
MQRKRTLMKWKEDISIKPKQERVLKQFCFVSYFFPAGQKFVYSSKHLTRNSTISVTSGEDLQEIPFAAKNLSRVDKKVALIYICL